MPIVAVVVVVGCSTKVVVISSFLRQLLLPKNVLLDRAYGFTTRPPLVGFIINAFKGILEWIMTIGQFVVVVVVGASTWTLLKLPNWATVLFCMRTSYRAAYKGQSP
jgi:hypothetical protein